MPASAPPIELWHSAFGPLIREFVTRAVQTFQPGQMLTSWHRTPESNAAAGGDPESQHLFSLAADIAGPGRDFTAHLARRLGLYAVQEFDHVHLQLFPAGVLARAGVEFPRISTVTRIV
jgi:hypothetical protein